MILLGRICTCSRSNPAWRRQQAGGAAAQQAAVLPVLLL
jgi:hypothetical protein